MIMDLDLVNISLLLIGTMLSFVSRVYYRKPEKERVSLLGPDIFLEAVS